MKFKLLLKSDVLSDITFQLYKHFLVTLSLFGELLLKIVLWWRIGRGTLIVLGWSINIDRCKGALVGHKLVLHLVKQPWFFFISFLGLRNPHDISLKCFLFLLDLGFPELLLLGPRFFENLKLIDPHVHENLNRVLYVVNNVQGIDLDKFFFLFVYYIVVHLCNFILRANFDIQVKIDDALANHVQRWVLIHLELAGLDFCQVFKISDGSPSRVSYRCFFRW